MNQMDEISLRPATSLDQPFLIAVYAESREAELAATGWSDEEKSAFCRSQFEAQDAHYREHFPGCEFLVIEEGTKPVGRLYIDRRPDEIRLVDIALLKDRRGRGIGGRLIQGILDEAANNGLMVRIHVERSNPARRLYDRLGFMVEEEGEIHDLLAWPKTL